LGFTSNVTSLSQFTSYVVRIDFQGRSTQIHGLRRWLETAASVEGFFGFAIGRTTFWDPLVDWRNQKVTREAAVTAIGRHYRDSVNIFEQARASRGKEPSKRKSTSMVGCASRESLFLRMRDRGARIGAMDVVGLVFVSDHRIAIAKVKGQQRRARIILVLGI
jgi:hypothetical protein